MSLNNAGKLRKYHHFIGAFSTKKGTFDHKSTNQPKPPEESSYLRNIKKTYPHHNDVLSLFFIP